MAKIGTVNNSKYQVGDIVNYWQIVRVYRYRHSPLWIYDLVRNKKKLTVDEDTLTRIFSKYVS